MEKVFSCKIYQNIKNNLEKLFVKIFSIQLCFMEDFKSFIHKYAGSPEQCIHTLKDYYMEVTA